MMPEGQTFRGRATGIHRLRPAAVPCRVGNGVARITSIMARGDYPAPLWGVHGGESIFNIVNVPPSRGGCISVERYRTRAHGTLIP